MPDQEKDEGTQDGGESGRMVLQDSTIRNRSGVGVGEEYVGDDTCTSYVDE